MLKHITRIALAAGIAAAAYVTVNAQTYQLPPRAVVDILDAAPTPIVLLSPDRQTIALLERRSMSGSSPDRGPSVSRSSSNCRL